MLSVIEGKQNSHEEERGTEIWVMRKAIERYRLDEGLILHMYIYSINFLSSMPAYFTSFHLSYQGIHLKRPPTYRLLCLAAKA